MENSTEMESTYNGAFIWTVAIITAGILTYATFRFYKRSRLGNPRNGINSLLSKTESEDSLSDLRDECWSTYVELEKLRSLKNKCAKFVAGDISIITAIRQLQSILDSGRGAEYMAPRIIGQVCDFVNNIAAANKMMSDDGRLIMPAPTPSLSDERSYFENLLTSSDCQAAKYKAVIEYQRSELQEEQLDMRFVNLLKEVMSPLQTVRVITKNEGQLSADEIVAKASLMYEEVLPILEKYGFKK